MIELISALEQVVDEALATIEGDPALGGVFSGATDRETYLLFLERTYHYVKETPVTIRTAAQALIASASPAYRELGKGLLHHAEEERGHEEWVLNDVRALGGDAERVREAVPNLAVRAYLADARFTASSRHPIAVFGEGYVLEGLAQRLGLQAARALAARSGIPNIERALSFLTSHGELDQGHVEELRGVLRVVEEEGDKRAILRRARSVAYQYTHLLHDR